MAHIFSFSSLKYFYCFVGLMPDSSLKAFNWPTHHLKYLNFRYFLNPTCLAHIFSFSSLKYFYCFVGPMPDSSLKAFNWPTHETLRTPPFSSLLIFPSSFSLVTLPTHKPELTKIDKFNLNIHMQQNSLFVSFQFD